MIWESIKMAFGSIRAAKMRSFLTMLGIIIGISSVVAINSIGKGLQAQVAGEVNSLGANVIFVLPGQVLSSKGGKQSFNPTASIGASTLTNQDITTIRQTDHVTEVAQLSLISGIVKQGQTEAPGALLIATVPDYANVIESPKIATGHFLDNAGEFTAVLGNDSRDTLFGKGASAIGKSVSIRGQDFKVVGIMGSSGSNGSSIGGPNLDDSVFINVKAAKVITGTDPSINRVGVKVDSQDNVNQSVDGIKTAVKKNHGGQEDFSVLTQKDLLSTVDTILNALTKAVEAIAAIALLVGGIGIMNIMLVAVTERTREIGIRKAIGATRTMILLQFLIEAAVLSLLGGGLGMLAAVGSGRAAGHAIKITPVFTSQIIATAVGISVAIGIVFGLAPAIKASRKSPMEALRYE